MILGLIDVMPEGETLDKKRGDVLIIVPTDWEWGNEEVRCHQVAELEDVTIEAALEAKKASGDRPVAIHPYAEYETNDSGRPVMVQRSTVHIDIDLLSNAVDIKDPSLEVARIPLAEVNAIRKARATRVGQLSDEDRARVGLST